MSDPRGLVTATVDGKSYALHLGMSVLAELQGKHGQNFLDALTPPDGAAPGWMPPLQIVVDILAGALRRYAAEVAGDRYFVDDLMAQNPGIFAALMAAQAGDKAAPGNAGGPGAAA